MAMRVGNQDDFGGSVVKKYTILIEESDEGFAVSVPELPGCHSQGDTEAEALANIADAIRDYLEVVELISQKR